MSLSLHCAYYFKETCLQVIKAVTITKKLSTKQEGEKKVQIPLHLNLKV